ncbi:uncharacterized protein LOC117605458 isoform X1 [Osmia lignaria lignaria]|uniref:uncharacterized protein LOC117605458 isoform X1 n=1 Tax=Osmia lignaria lignaria TaxID=1437193 RepID=UPI00402B95EA
MVEPCSQTIYRDSEGSSLFKRNTMFMEGCDEFQKRFFFYLQFIRISLKFIGFRINETFLFLHKVKLALYSPPHNVVINKLFSISEERDRLRHNFEVMDALRVNSIQLMEELSGNTRRLENYQSFERKLFFACRFKILQESPIQSVIVLRNFLIESLICNRFKILTCKMDALILEKHLRCAFKRI